MRFDVFFLVSLACLVLFACGGKPKFQGTFTATYLGQNAQLQLEQNGSQVAGLLTYAGVSGKLEAQAAEAVAKGSVQMGLLGNLGFEATLQPDGSLRWRYLTPLPGQFQALEITFQPQSTSTSTAASAGASIDPNLVGHWRRTLSSTVPGVYPSENLNTATDIYCTLSANGSYQYGGSVTGAGGPGIAGVTGAGQVVSGEWKAEGGVLYARNPQVPQWIPLGQYTISGSSMILNANGDKQLWER